MDVKREIAHLCSMLKPLDPMDIFFNLIMSQHGTAILPLHMHHVQAQTIILCKVQGESPPCVLISCLAVPYAEGWVVCRELCDIQSCVTYRAVCCVICRGLGGMQKAGQRVS